jgi:serine/threonine protein kinase/Tfp pilus assembly protein PilF
MAAALERLIGSLVDRYRFERELGRGGMAIVYLATDLKHHRKVAIKVLKPELAAALGPERFLREIAITAQLTHPHILTLIDSGEAEGFLYYVLPFVEGESLRQLLEREKQLPIEDALRIARELADALSYAHSQGIIHRDIKPENVLLEQGHAVLSDFGIARAVQAAGGDALTETGLALGTPLYMSPEQAAGDRMLDARSDIYSLGCIVYEMLTGEPPFRGATAQAVLARKSLETVPSLRVVRRGVPLSIEHAVVRALASTPADRFATARQFAEALENAQDAPAPIVEVPRRRRAWQSGLAALLAVLLLGSGWWVLGRPNVRIDSLAVLPLRNLSGDTAQTYFLDAMHGEIIAELGHIAALRTISQWSASRYRQTTKSIPEIARELGVDAIVQATVNVAGDRVRIQVELIQAVPRERQLWAYSYNGNLRNVLALQAEVARGIAEQIRVTITPQEEARLTRAQPVDPEAYDAYARGRFAWNKFTADGFSEAIKYFQKAIDKAPNYALAYAGLADAYRTLPYYAAVDPREAFPKSRAAATRALELDETLAEPYTALGWTTAAYEWNWSRAEQYFRRALELKPSYAVGHMTYAHFLAWEARFEEAIGEDLRARELDPLSPRIESHLGLMYYLARQYDRAIELYEETLTRYPNFVRARWDLGRAYFEKGQYQRAIAEFEQAIKVPGQSSTGSATSIAELARALARAGRRGEALKILRDLEAQRKRGYRPALNIASIYVALDDREQAFRWLELAYDARDADMILLKVLPTWDPVRADPRFQDLLRRVGFPEMRTRASAVPGHSETSEVGGDPS